MTNKIEFADKRYMTPPCEAAFAYLVTPDTKYGDPTFKITGLFDPKDPEVKAMVKDIQEFVTSYCTSQGVAVPKPGTDGSIIKKHKDADKKLTGKLSIQFKSTAKANDDGTGFIPVAVVDANKQAVKNGCWGGDTVRIAFGLGGWNSSFGTGVKPYLNAVQRLVSTQTAGNAASVFDVVEEYIDSSASDSTDIFATDTDTKLGTFEVDGEPII